MHHRRLLDYRLSGCGAGGEDGDVDHLDVEGRRDHEAEDVAREGRLRQVGQGCNERHGLSDSLAPTRRCEATSVRDDDPPGAAVYPNDGDLAAKAVAVRVRAVNVGQPAPVG